MKRYLPLIASLACASLNAQVTAAAGGSIDAGGASDSNFSGGQVWTFPNVAGDATVRYAPDTAAGAHTGFTYTLPCAPAVLYALNFGMVEGSQTAAGARLFNVTLNDQSLLSRFDLFTAAGVAPTTRSFPCLCPASGALLLNFTTVFRSALVSWIEYHPVAAQPPGTNLLLGGRQVVETFSLGDPVWAAAIAGGATSISYTLKYAPATGTAIMWGFSASTPLYSTISAVIATSPAAGRLIVSLPAYRPLTVQDVVTIIYWTLDAP